MMRPTCTVCGAPVERLALEHDNFMQRLRVRVWCHGRTEHVDIPEAELEGAKNLSFGGRAFVDELPRLAP
jgi:hypothetical protein